MSLDHGVSCGQEGESAVRCTVTKLLWALMGYLVSVGVSGSWWKREPASRGRPSLLHLWEDDLLSCFCRITDLCWKWEKLCMIESKGDIEDGFHVPSISAGTLTAVVDIFNHLFSGQPILSPDIIKESCPSLLGCFHSLPSCNCQGSDAGIASAQSPWADQINWQPPLNFLIPVALSSEYANFLIMHWHFQPCPAHSSAENGATEAQKHPQM